MKEINIIPVDHKPFLKAGLRLLHAQFSGPLVPPSWNDFFSSFHYAAPAPDMCYCGSLWRPGWGLHSASRLVEVKLSSGAQIVVFSHDAWSERAYSSEDINKDAHKWWGDRRVGSGVMSHIECVRSPGHLDHFRQHIKMRQTTAGHGCKDPVNEVWFRAIDVVAVRRISTSVRNTHDTSVRIKTTDKEWACPGKKMDK